MNPLDDIDGPAAPPRLNGQVAFDAPWQGQAFGLAAAVIDQQFGGDREPFRTRLIQAIACDPARPYWESWAAALETLTVDTGLVTADAIDAAVDGRLTEED